MAKQHSIDYTKSEIVLLKSWTDLINTNITETNVGIVNAEGKRIKTKLTHHVNFKSDYFKTYLYG